MWERWRAWELGDNPALSALLGDDWPDLEALDGSPMSGTGQTGVPRLGARAVLAEGVWQEPGQVSWFGTSTATAASVASYGEWYVRFWLSLPKEAEITLVECDI